jgi:hypothetical protein
MDDEKPPAKRLVLKPKEIIPIDTLSRPGDGSAISVQLIHQQNRLAEEKAARKMGEVRATPDDGPALPAIFKPKEIIPLDAPVRPNDDEAIAVPDILLENRAAEERSGWGKVSHRKGKISRRTRDFLLGVGSADLVIILATCAAHDSISMVYGISALTLLTSSVAWIMFVVMDDY